MVIQKGNKIPDYRNVKGEIKGWNPYYGWCPVILQDSKIENELSFHLVADSIPNLKDIYDKSTNNIVLYQLSANLNKTLSEACNFTTKFALIISKNQIFNIMERVRNILLDWSITLEENNILGDGLSFTENEKDIATSRPIINNYTNNFYGNVQSTKIQQDTSKSMQK